MRRCNVLGLCVAICLMLLLQPSGIAAAYSYDQTAGLAKTTTSPLAIGNGWTVNHAFTGTKVQAVARGDKGYIAVGEHGTMLISQNGSNWSALTPIGDYNYSLIASSGEQYVVVGADNQARGLTTQGFLSKDGATWTAIEFPDQAVVYSLIWGKDRYVAATNKGVLSSKDGLAWESVHAAFGIRVEYSNNHFIIYDVENSKLLVSTDGVSWTQQSFPKQSYVEFGAYMNGKYVAFSYNAIYTSTNLKSWSKQKNTMKDVAFTQIVPYKGGYMLLGKVLNSKTSRGEMVAYHTTNGTTWTKKAMTNFPYTKVFLFAEGDKLIGLGTGEEDALYSLSSTNYTSWTSKLVGVNERGNFAGIATNGTRTVAVGNFGAIVYTDNGTKWNAANALGYQTISRPNFYDVAYGASKFVAYGSAGPYYSSDGIAWKQGKLKLDYTFGHIEWTGSFFVVVDQYHGVYMSKDGISWTKGTGIAKDARPYAVVAKGKQVIVAASVFGKSSTYTQLYQSTNGTSWSKLATLPTENALIAWNGKTFVAMDQYNTKVVWLSKDGKSWKKQTGKITHKSSITSLQAIDGQFVATNNGYVEGAKAQNQNAVYVSKDGVNWNAIIMPEVYSSVDYPLNNAYMNKIVKAYGGYLAAGEQGYLYRLDSLK